MEYFVRYNRNIHSLFNFFGNLSDIIGWKEANAVRF